MRVLTALVLAVAVTSAVALPSFSDLFASVRSAFTPGESSSGSAMGRAMMTGLKTVQTSSVVRKLITSLETKTNRSAHTDAGKPKFCNDLDCPQFTIVESNKDYEVRKYVGTQWVTTAMNGLDLDVASYKMFMKLFKYISGQNEKQEKIAMTCPVLMRIIPGQGPACENNFTMSFFVTEQSAPKPTDATVSLTSMPAMTVYVRSFGGFADKNTWIQEAQALAAALPTSASFHSDFYYTAGYDAPFKFLNRHNEVWFFAK